MGMIGPKLEKAFIEVIGGSPPARKIPVLFNPAEYSMERANSYKSTPIPGLGSPLIQFVNGDATTLTMDLFFDDYTDPPGMPDLSPTGIVGSFAGEQKSTDDRIREIVGLLDIDAHLHAPPRVRFVWGPLKFEAVLEKVGRKITLFHASGRPARATLSVSFREYQSLDKQLDFTRRMSSDKTKRRQIRASDSIWIISHREYRDVRNWRHIAHASDVDDPRSLQPGEWVKVPPLEQNNAIARQI
jgi:Contractile injection system tube protein